MIKDHFSDTVHEQLTKHQAEQSPVAFWVEMIRDMVDGLGYTYSRIAKRIGVAPSTIQKLATRPGRKPRHVVFHSLLCLYYKLFYSELRMPQADQYLKIKEQRKELQRNAVKKDNKKT